MKQKIPGKRLLPGGMSILLICSTFISSCSGRLSADILVAGGSASGVAAGIQAARMGAATVIVEEHEWLGGMLTSAGVSAADGNYNLPGGIWGEFREALAAHYGGDSLLRTGWVSNILFEPSVGNGIFSAMAAAEPHLEVVLDAVVTKAERRGKKWKVTVRKGDELIRYSARILIDATELGDIAAMCGVRYDLGMDSGLETGEEIAPEKANDIVQDLTYVAILKDYGTAVPLERPEGYDSTLFACACINPLCAGTDREDPAWSCDKMLSYGRLPGNKYMINWPVSGNDYYVNLIEMDAEARDEALIPAKQKTLWFVYFINHDLGFNTLALADDEFPTPDRLPFIPYYRESRRIRGKVRFTLDHITDPYGQADKLYRTAVAVGDYPVDHHHSAYTGDESLPDLSFRQVPSFGLPLGTLIPEDTEGLIVAEKSISVTNLVNGATRLQPVVLQTGQAAGALGALAVSKGVEISGVQVREVQNALLEAGGYLLPYLDVPVNHPWFKSLQRVGATGIMKSVGKSQGWSNQTWFRAFEPAFASDLTGIKEFFPEAKDLPVDTILTVGATVDLIRTAASGNGIEINDVILSDVLGMIFSGAAPDPDRRILRGEAAMLIDMTLDPFNRFQVDLKGSFREPLLRGSR
jgi:hypothetical protein